MAGEWIKMRTNLWDDPRVSRLCDLTGAGEAAIVGGLYWLWAMADEHTEDGILPGLTTRAIDRKTGVNGLGAALVSISWLVEHPEGVTIVGFEEHNGTSAKRRCVDAQTKANKRKSSTGDQSDVRNVSGQDADNVRTEQGQKTPTCGAREEKRRIDTTTASAGAIPSVEVFPIQDGWTPSPAFATQSKLLGLPVLDDIAMSSGVSEFIAYWMTRPHEIRTQAEWDNALAKSLKRRLVSNAGKPPNRPTSPTKAPNHGGHDVVEPA